MAEKDVYIGDHRLHFSGTARIAVNPNWYVEVNCGKTRKTAPLNQLEYQAELIALGYVKGYSHCGSHWWFDINTEDVENVADLTMKTIEILGKYKALSDTIAERLMVDARLDESYRLGEELKRQQKDAEVQRVIDALSALNVVS